MRLLVEQVAEGPGGRPHLYSAVAISPDAGERRQILLRGAVFEAALPARRGQTGQLAPPPVPPRRPSPGSSAPRCASLCLLQVAAARQAYRPRVQYHRLLLRRPALPRAWGRAMPSGPRRSAGRARVSARSAASRSARADRAGRRLRRRPHGPGPVTARACLAPAGAAPPLGPCSLPTAARRRELEEAEAREHSAPWRAPVYHGLRAVPRLRVGARDPRPATLTPLPLAAAGACPRRHEGGGCWERRCGGSSGRIIVRRESVPSVRSSRVEKPRTWRGGRTTLAVSGGLTRIAALWSPPAPDPRLPASSLFTTALGGYTWRRWPRRAPAPSCDPCRL